MKKVYTAVAMVLAMYSCQTNQITIIEGDLYFKLVDLPSLYEVPDSIATKLETSIRTVQKDSLTTLDRNVYNQLQFLDDNQLLRKPFIRVQKDSLTTLDRNVYNQLQFLDDNQLLRKPFIRLRQNDGRILLVFVEPSDYEKLRKYHHQELVRTHKKISVTAKVERVKNNTLNFYKASHPITLQETDGITYWNK
ncbi:MAG: hypothetical protein EAZ62_10045 [Sphingobacteriia bacterium]|nr:MAG: hypothetical protein EAZ62_10045 [Sphingobacteriia bacterium]